MNIAETRKTYKAIWSLLVLMGATLQSSDNGANPGGIYSFRNYPVDTTVISICRQGIRFIGSDIGRLVNLEKLDLKGNNLKALPPEIGELKNLQHLDLRNNKLESLPPEIEELKNLQHLDLGDNKLKALPYEVEELKNLQHLDLGYNQFESFPTVIRKLKNLERLILNNNKFGLFPIEIAELKKLQILYLRGNKLKLLPDEIGEMKELRELGLDDNELESFPTVIAELRKLQTLDLGYNEFESFPTVIVKLKNLQYLFLNDNKLKLLPDEIGELENLRELNLRGNKLETLPPVIGELENLYVLELYKNNLESLPDVIGKLKNLGMLNLGNNKIETLPAAIGELQNLRELYLSDNKLETLPVEIEKLSGSLRLLNLMGNNMSEVGDGERTVGRRELRAIFGDRVVLDNDIVEYEEDEISVGDVYSELKSKPMHWNFEMLRTLRPQSVPELKCSEEELVRLWNESMFVREWDRLRPEVIETIEASRRVLVAVYGEGFSALLRTDVDGETRNRNITEIVTKVADNKNSYTKQRNISKLTGNDKNTFKDMWEKNSRKFIMGDNKRTMDEFIHHIYNPDKEYRRWRMKKEHTGLAKNLLGAILNALSKESDGDVVVSNINVICEGLGYCPDRQISEMMFVHNLLTGDVEEQEGSSLEDRVRKVVETWVGQEKERVFDIAVTPLNVGQNVHVQNFWRYELRDDVGLDFEFQTGIIGREQLARMDRFRLRPGNALRAFYRIFTPEHMIDVLTGRINSRGRIVSMIAQLICTTEISNEDRKRMCRWDEKEIPSGLSEDVEYMVGCIPEITREFAKYFLVKMGVIVERGGWWGISSRRLGGCLLQ
ncbi:uncharacterized protein VICG_00614 [Vittaforma corneae ATCC 50505]|uniref:Disease resistance R13L4/SHOC-2-like LRR domain-containing protein n=1 Tax=Vittaforma corneae (strain ATCC 50505) TaxID=993615 RepID=L2GPT1_VITCO|nr:uncharacterized protein VICG_00614 [Vittaforma corneae ATCC 50505]ELA42515.1 hypothetical protein VICG_00614 [Vittaforma corneae ATCC 50505]